MIRIIFLLFCIVLTSPATAMDDLWADTPKETKEELTSLPIVLKQSVNVSGEYILLGDIFSGLEASKDGKKVSSSPALGKEAILTVEWLEKIAHDNKLSWTPSDKNISVTVKRNASKITKTEIEAFLIDPLHEQGLPNQAELNIQKGKTPVLVPVDSSWELQPIEVKYNPSYQSFSAELKLLVNGKKQEELFFSGKAQTFVKLPTARETLSVGQIITKDDIFMKSTPQERGRRRIEPLNIDDLIGKEIKKTIKAGQTITPRDVQTQVMVAKGKTVTLNFTKAGIMLTTQGKALENGGLGDTVRVMNTQSKSVVQGTVTGPETVSVTTLGQ